jgi:hypothetical protein
VSEPEILIMQSATGEKTLQWRFDGREVFKDSKRVRTVTIIPKSKCVLVVWEITSVPDISNAAVYDYNGKERCRVVAPRVRMPMGFDQAYLNENGNPVAVLHGADGDVIGIVDTANGSLESVHPWR